MQFFMLVRVRTLLAELSGPPDISQLRSREGLKIDEVYSYMFYRFTTIVLSLKWPTVKLFNLYGQFY